MSVSSSSSASSIAAPAPNPAQRCADDALHCVFSFLPLRSLVGVLRTCREWLHSAAKTHGRRDSVVVSCRPALATLLASSLRVHVASLSLEPHPSLSNLAASLHAIGSLMPQLTSLRAHLPVPRDPRATQTDEPPEVEFPHASVSFPPSLRSLTLDHDVGHFDDWPLLLRSLARSSPRLRELSISTGTQSPHLPAWSLSSEAMESRVEQDDSVDLSPLLSLRELRVLRISTPSGISCSQAAIINRMEILRELSCNGGYLSSEAIQALCFPAHSLASLQLLDLCHTSVGLRELSLLARLPALTRLEPGFVHVTALAAGSGLVFSPRLTSLRVRIDDGWTQAQQMATQYHGLVDALRACSRLTALDIGFPPYGPIFEPMLRDTLAVLAPSLRKLRLRFLSADNLSFLQGLYALEELDMAAVERVSLATHLPMLCESTPMLHRLVLRPGAQLTPHVRGSLPDQCRVEFAWPEH